MTTYAINPEKNGIEIAFSQIPSKTTRATLKAQGWRWSRFGGFWYNRNTPENEQTARDLADGKAPTPAQHKNAILDGLQAQKEYKQRQARTYWKRFGGSKLHAWTYSMND